MQIIRTILWIVLTAIIVAFIAMNWDKAPVRFWPMDDGDFLLFEWPVGLIGIIFFALGFIPLWLYHRGAIWRMQRRISALESAARNAAMALVPDMEPAEAEETPHNPQQEAQ